MPSSSDHIVNADQLWRRFVRLALWCALLPGFGLATVMVCAWRWGWAAGLWYPAAIQTHATALLMGWGGAMILGVALHFLPRLRGVKLVHAEWVPALFWLLTAGLTGRIVGQPLLALLQDRAPLVVIGGLNGIIVIGLVLQAVGMGGLLGVLLLTFRTGRPLAQNKGFKQIAPLLAVAALALGLAQLAWCGGAVSRWAQGLSLVVLPEGAQSTAVDLMLGGFVAAIGIAMSSRLFPLTFRMQLPHERGLVAAAVLLGGGVILTGWAGLRFTGAATNTVWPQVAVAGGLLIGAWAVRIFHARKKIVAPAAPYRVWEDPAAVGVLTAYGWLVVAAGLFLLPVGLRLGLALPDAWLQPNLARHALGLGFMTQLIVSVGWKMLPGFGGGTPQGRGLIWSAVLLGNLAVGCRIGPALLVAGPATGRNWSETLYPVAGLAALTAVLLFALALRRSLRKSVRSGPS